MHAPEGLLYTKDHEWLRRDGDVFTIGVTDFAQRQLTDVVFVELPALKSRFERGKSMAVIESVKSVSEVYAPIEGEVVEINGSLEDAPEQINADPYTKGWLVKIRFEGQDISHLMDASSYMKLLGQ